MPGRGIKKEDKKAEWSQRLVKSRVIMLIPLSVAGGREKRKRETHAYNSLYICKAFSFQNYLK